MTMKKKSAAIKKEKEPGFIKSMLIRIKVDWAEFKYHTYHMSDLRRDNKRIKRAVQTAKEKNSVNGRKYFILRDVRGFPAAYTRREIKELKAAKIIPKEANHVDLDKYSIAIVTSNKVEFNQYTQIQNKQESE